MKTWQEKLETLPPSWRVPMSGFLAYKRAGGCAPATIRNRFYQLGKFAREVGTSPKHVTSSQLVAALDVDMSNNNRKSLHDAFSTFFKWCQETGVRADNPTDALPRVRPTPPNPRPCPDEYISAAMAKANDSERLMLRLAAECGLRRIEIARVHSRDVVRDSSGHRSLVVMGKGDKQRIVPLPDSLADTVEASNGYAFPGRFGGHATANFIGERLSALLPDGWSGHKLRHRFATIAYADSHDMLAVSRALGHASVETTMHYTALPDAGLRPLVDAAALPDGVESNGPHVRKCLATMRRETLRALGLLSLQLLADSRHGGIREEACRSFAFDLAGFSAVFDRPSGSGQSAPLPLPLLWEAAKFMERDGLIELVGTSGDIMRGNFITDYQRLDDTANEYANAYVELSD